MDKLLRITCDSMEQLVSSLKKNRPLSDIQKAKLNFIKTRMSALTDVELIRNDIPEFVIDSGNRSLLLKRAVAYIIQSQPTKGIPLLLEYLDNADLESDSAVYAKIYLAESYRQSREYPKGIDLLYEVLKNQNISPKNRAFAYNRLAALYIEGGGYYTEYRYDSAIKYSNRCIIISEKNGFTGHLATSQNELAFIHRVQEKLQLSLEYGLNAIDNFIIIKMYPQAMNASINLAKTYMSLKQYNKAAETYRNALKLSDVNKNTVLFMRIYLHLSNACFALGDYRAAYEYQKIVREMQGDLHNKWKEMQIYDMTAKYNLQEKEIEIIKEQQKSKIYSQQKKYLAIIAGISLLLFFILLLLFRFKSRAYKSLVQKNLELAQCDRKILESGEIIPLSVKEKGSRDSKDSNELIKELEIIEKFNAYLSEEKPYLFGDINIEEVSAQLETNRTYLSRAINTVFNKSFNTIINEFRIRTARQLLTDEKYSHLSIEGIGQMAGYHSRTAFINNFKKITGLTPSYFKGSILKKS